MVVSCWYYFVCIYGYTCILQIHSAYVYIYIMHCVHICLQYIWIYIHIIYIHIQGFTLLGTNISSKNGILKMIFLFPRWDMLISWRVYIQGFYIFQKPWLTSFEGIPQHLIPSGQALLPRGAENGYIHSPKLTANAPENAPGPKRKIHLQGPC